MHVPSKQPVTVCPMCEYYVMLVGWGGRVGEMVDKIPSGMEMTVSYEFYVIPHFLSYDITGLQLDKMTPQKQTNNLLNLHNSNSAVIKFLYSNKYV